MPLPACAISQSAACSCHVLSRLPLTIPSLSVLFTVPFGYSARWQAERGSRTNTTASGNSLLGFQGLVPASAPCRDVMAGLHTQKLCAAKEKPLPRRPPARLLGTVFRSVSFVLSRNTGPLLHPNKVCCAGHLRTQALPLVCLASSALALATSSV